MFALGIGLRMLDKVIALKGYLTSRLVDVFPLELKTSISPS